MRVRIVRIVCTGITIENRLTYPQNIEIPALICDGNAYTGRILTMNVVRARIMFRKNPMIISMFELSVFHYFFVDEKSEKAPEC